MRLVHRCSVSAWRWCTAQTSTCWSTTRCAVGAAPNCGASGCITMRLPPTTAATVPCRWPAATTGSSCPSSRACTAARNGARAASTANAPTWRARCCRSSPAGCLPTGASWWWQTRSTRAAPSPSGCPPARCWWDDSVTTPRCSPSLASTADAVVRAPRVSGCRVPRRCARSQRAGRLATSSCTAARSTSSSRRASACGTR
jgi:hypothetical protein